MRRLPPSSSFSLLLPGSKAFAIARLRGKRNSASCQGIPRVQAYGKMLDGFQFPAFLRGVSRAKVDEY